MTAEIEMELWDRDVRMEGVMEPDLDHLLSDADLSEVEAIYKKDTTPLRCRFGWHTWDAWLYMLSIQYGAISEVTLRESEAGQIDLEVRLCRGCMKTQARTVLCPPDELDPLEWGEEDDE